MIEGKTIVLTLTLGEFDFFCVFISIRSSRYVNQDCVDSEINNEDSAYLGGQSPYERQFRTAVRLDSSRLIHYSFISIHDFSISFLNRIYDLCFSADGTQLIAAAGNKVLVYEALTGSLLHSLKGDRHYKNHFSY